MKQIKFRAWDKFGKTFILWEEIKRVWEAWALTNDTFDVQQYTGLKDKNGIEIYEGDILRSNVDFLYSVEWDNRGGYILIAKPPMNDENVERKAPFYFNDLHKDEVVGNIYEHPWLLHSTVDRRTGLVVLVKVEVV